MGESEVYIKCSQLWGQGGVGAGARQITPCSASQSSANGKARPGELRLTHRHVQFKAMNRRCKVTPCQMERKQPSREKGTEQQGK